MANAETGLVGEFSRDLKETKNDRGDDMPDREKVIKGLECRAYDNDFPCSICAYYKRDDEHAIPYCDYRGLMDDAIELLKEQEEERKRMISWLGKFCRHIDNGDKWLSDEENIAFFREKMKQQFGWDS